MEEKKAIRKQIFAARRDCSQEQIRTWSREITARVLSLPEFQEAKQILVYADYNHEVMTGEIIKAAWKAGKETAVPRVTGKDMVFCALTDFSQLSPGYFGIPEPETGEPVTWENALMLMPGVAFDSQCRRVGYGGGFYDRYLELHPDLKRVALAFEFQVLSQVPTEPTDISPEILVTEKRILRV